MISFANNLLKPFKDPLPCSTFSKKMQVAGLKFYYPKDTLDKSEWPEQRKLRFIEKQPVFDIKIPKMYKMINRMRGPEAVHNQLIYKGFGIKTLLGGRLKFEHFEKIRNTINIKIDEKRMFAIWRVSAPWQPLSKKSTGKRMGLGKGSVHHYCTPVKADRIIVELGGDVHEIEARKILNAVAQILPFPARFVSQKDLENEKISEEWIEKNNINPYTMEYVIRNNMGGCHSWLSKYDFMWFGKYR